MATLIKTKIQDPVSFIFQCFFSSSTQVNIHLKSLKTPLISNYSASNLDSVFFLIPQSHNSSGNISSENDFKVCSVKVLLKAKSHTPQQSSPLHKCWSSTLTEFL